MSIKCIQNVLENSDTSGTDRLVLIVIAYHANDEGENAFPSIATIAAECGGLSDRYVRRILRKLEKSGALRINVAAGPNGTNTYSIPMRTPGSIDQPPRVNTPGVTPGPETPPGGSIGQGGEGPEVRDPGSIDPPNRKEPSINRQTTTTSGGGGDERVPTFSEISTMYLQNIGNLGPMQAEFLKDAFDEFGPLELEFAITRAVQANALHWGYVSGVLERRRNGSDSRRNGATRNGRTTNTFHSKDTSRRDHPYWQSERHQQAAARIYGDPKRQISVDEIDF